MASEQWLEFTMDFDHQRDVVGAGDVTGSMAKWMAELSLPTIPEAITLVLDGGPDPDLMSRIFQEVVHRDAAWQEAINRVFHSEHFLQARIYYPYFYQGFPELLRAMSKNDPSLRIRCNFSVGQPWNNEQVNQIIDEHKHISQPRDWKYAAWSWWRGLTFRPPPPLPDFHTLKEENVFPEGWISRTRGWHVTNSGVVWSD
jgi:hypothetical protein